MDDAHKQYNAPYEKYENLPEEADFFTFEPNHLRFAVEIPLGQFPNSPKLWPHALNLYLVVRASRE